MGFFRRASHKDVLQTQLASSSAALTPAQRKMYKSERAVNFRWIAWALSPSSSTALTEADLVSDDILSELKDLGQFAELAYSVLPLDFTFHNLAILTQEGFPLHGYSVLREAELVTTFQTAVQIYIAHRQCTGQLIVAISGTASLKSVYHDLRANMIYYPGAPSRCRCKVHSGFWSMYSAFRKRLLEDVVVALSKFDDVRELVLIGHSMGGALIYLFALDLLTKAGSADAKLPALLSLISFGAPRCGNRHLADYWHERVEGYREENGRESIRELAVRGYNDGVPALPPLWMGYRHFCKEPFYFFHGHLYRIPETEREYGLFPVTRAESAEPPEHPKGGHNYYNGRDMELGARRMYRLARLLEKGQEGWEERYRRAMSEEERVK